MRKQIAIILLMIVCSVSLYAQEKQLTVLFEYNKSEIPDSSMLALVKILAKNTIDHVLIEGHCDSIGSIAYNKLLSKRRADEVKLLLTTNELDNKLINTCIGYGKSKPLNSNSSEEERQQNRRVVIHFDCKPSVETKAAIAKPTLKAKEFKVGRKILLEHLFFQGGRHFLQPSSEPVLENLIDILKEKPSMKIEIQGHVCCTSIEEDGYDIDTRSNNLSVNRARTVFDYLKKGGIDTQRLQYRGFGGTHKISLQESTEEQQQLNRRVEIKILAE